MNDIEAMKHIRRMRKLGVNENHAKDIVNCVSENGYDDAERAIEYAIKLMYGYSIEYSKSRNFYS